MTNLDRQLIQAASMLVHRANLLIRDAAVHNHENHDALLAGLKSDAAEVDELARKRLARWRTINDAADGKLEAAGVLDTAVERMIDSVPAVSLGQGEYRRNWPEGGAR